MRKFTKHPKNTVIASKKPIKAWSANTIVDLQAVLEDIADKYEASTPVSGDWSTETDQEVAEIADALNISEDSAKALMIHELGFSEMDFL